MKNVAIQLFNGVDEKDITKIRHTKRKDEEGGQSLFRFNNPDVLSSDNFKEIQGMYLKTTKGE
tara:strand:+ start:184 stop:372 length:189 start_codon:yes stop_codon:yes gene_type:complete